MRPNILHCDIAQIEILFKEQIIKDQPVMRGIGCLNNPNGAILTGKFCARKRIQRRLLLHHIAFNHVTRHSAALKERLLNMPSMATSLITPPICMPASL